MKDRQTVKKVWEKSKYFLIAAIFLYIQQLQMSFCLVKAQKIQTVLEQVQIEISTAQKSMVPVNPIVIYLTRAIKGLIPLDPRWVVINIMIVAIPLLLLLCICRRLDLAVMINAVFITIVSYVNINIIVYHGSPFFAPDIYSAGTALNVIGSYKPVFNIQAACNAGFLILQLGMWIFLRSKMNWFRRRISIKAALLTLAANTGLIYLWLFSPMTLFPKNLITFQWDRVVKKYGYSLCLCNSAYSLSHVMFEPEGYDAEAIQAEPASQGDGSRPDIIVIVNESLFDISRCTDVPESEALFRNIRDIPGIISGYAAVSGLGGGTNDTEFELLTSNSLSLLNVYAPFSSMSMAGRSSVVSYLNQLGYTTTGMHCKDATNYARNRSYPDLGFDNTILGESAFRYFSKNGNRRWLDSDNYRDLLEQYEACGESPRFMYMLTYQNHGGYEQNDPDMDTITVASQALGNLTDDVNEYLSSIEKSVSAFRELISRLQDSTRPLVVLMVGDHAPSFIKELPPVPGRSSVEQDIAMRMVPYFIWSNVPLEEAVFQEYTSMTDLIPMLVKASGLPVSSYYETIVKMAQTLPVRTYSGYYRDSQAQCGTIAENEAYAALVRNYTYMEYNNLKMGEDYRADWFQPQENG